MNKSDYLILSVLREDSTIRPIRTNRNPSPPSRPAGVERVTPENPFHKQNSDKDHLGIKDDKNIIRGRTGTEQPNPSFKTPKVRVDRFRSRIPAQPHMTTRRHYGKKHGINVWRRR